ncbi:MAG TPA: hypothetical protein PKD86_07190 [Gemmatales bacterium]|nr:hypothetical protein [Gemmatales bacterium]
MAALQAQIEADELVGKDAVTVRSILQNAFDERYRPEMRSMERSLLLHVIDSKWNAHLYTMDHLRAGVGLVSYAQIDPKIEYKRQGMKAFDEMWDSIDVEVTDPVFRMDEHGSGGGEHRPPR